MIMRARAADGPYAGQTFEFPFPEIHWYAGPGHTPIGPLIWIINGADRHCYQLVENTPYGSFRLIYRDTF
jgi:hypothetical protein